MITSEAFVATIQSMRRPYVIERSIKLSDGHASRDRVLVTFDRPDLGPDDWSSLKAMTETVERFDFPRECRQWLRRYHGGATALHLGREADTRGATLKIYLEYATSLRDATQDVAVLLHRALKWRPTGDAMLACTYTARPRDPRPMDTRLLDYRAETPPALMEVARGLARQAMTAVSDDALRLLDVSDETGRRSFDLTLYDAAIMLGDADWALSALADIFSLPSTARAALFASPQEMFGHIACGRTGAGAPFATVYYGARRIATL